MIIQIDTRSRASLQDAIRLGVTTPELLAAVIDNAAMIDGSLVVEPGFFADDGNAEVHYEAASSGQEAAEEYVSEGDWGDDGGAVTVYTWRAGIDADGDAVRVGEETHEIDIDIDHAALIGTAAGHLEICGTSPDDHDWTSEGEGGLVENPGVWSLGGTKMLFRAHCRVCGLRREEVHSGSQRNPGDAEIAVKYSIAEESQ